MQFQELVWMQAEDNLGRHNGELHARRKIAAQNQLLEAIRARQAKALAKCEKLQQEVRIQEGLIRSQREVIAVAEGAQGSMEEVANALQSQNELLENRKQLDEELWRLEKDEVKAPQGTFSCQSEGPQTQRA